MANRSAASISPKQPAYKRQQFLLALIQRLDGRITATDLQKLVFLYTMKTGAKYYDFVPYKFGAYSFQLAQDIEILRKDGYVTEDNKPVNPEQYPCVIALDMSAIERARGNNLIRKAYERYPYYAIKSEIADKILNDTALVAVHAAKRQLINEIQMLLSIGYEGKSIESFINTLLINDVKLLCDVRRNPISRKFGFSKNKLMHIAEGVGISYFHMPELGIDSTERQSLETAEDYRALFASYKESLPAKTKALQKVHSLLESNTRIALMCYEQDPNCCHRTIIKNYLANAYNLESEDL